MKESAPYPGDENDKEVKMKRKLIRSAALLLAVLTVCAALVSCGGIRSRYKSYDSTGENYDYDLTEYVAVPEYRGIEIPDITYTPSTEDIDNDRMVKRSYFAPEEDVDEPCEPYDLVDADYSATLEGEEYVALDSSVDNSRRSFMVGIGKFMIPEVDEAIVGMKPGETKTISFKLPEPYLKDVKNSGKTGEFTITIDRVRRQDLPEYTDEFVGQYYGAGSASEYDEEIATQLTHDVSQYFEGYEDDLTWDYLITNTRIYKYPGKQLNEARDALIKRFQLLAEEKEMGFDEYIRSLGYESNAEFYDNYVEPRARSLVEEEMILYFIARCENISVKDEDLKSEVLDYGSYYQLSDYETSEKAVLRDFNTMDAFKEWVLFKQTREYITSKAVKIDTATYYAKKNAGEYTLSDEEILKDTDQFDPEILIIVGLCALGAAIAGVIVFLIVRLRKEVEAKNRRRAEREALEEKRRIRRELKAAKKAKKAHHSNRN